MRLIGYQPEVFYMVREVLSGCVCACSWHAWAHVCGGGAGRVCLTSSKDFVDHNNLANINAYSEAGRGSKPSNGVSNPCR